MNAHKFAALLFCAGCVLFASAAQARPNVLILMTDDQRWDDLDLIMPQTKTRIFDEGRRFMKGYITTPACCPSRACIFTGMYASRHKALTNGHYLQRKTIFEHLKEHYFQGLIGKYLNTWDGSARPEFDYWVSFKGGSSRYIDPLLFVNSRRAAPVKGYITEIFQDHALKFLDRAAKQRKPFFLAVTFNAPHAPSVPMPEDIGRYDNLPLQVTEFPNYLLSLDAKIAGNRPYWLRRKGMGPAIRERMLDQAKRERECLAPVDRAVDAIVAKLEALGKLDDTIIFFLSDNGLMRGEHGLRAKDTVYESAIKVPFAVRYPVLIAPAVDKENLVAGIDIVPTIYDLIEIEPHPGISGKSMLPIFTNVPGVFRDSLLIEGFRALQDWSRVPFAAVHTGRYVYAVNQRIADEPAALRYELYDLEDDPYQLVNLLGHGPYLDIQKRLDLELNALLLRYRGNSGFRVAGAKRVNPGRGKKKDKQAKKEKKKNKKKNRLRR